MAGPILDAAPGSVSTWWLTWVSVSVRRGALLFGVAGLPEQIADRPSSLIRISARTLRSWEDAARGAPDGLAAAAEGTLRAGFEAVAAAYSTDAGDEFERWARRIRERFVPGSELEAWARWSVRLLRPDPLSDEPGIGRDLLADVAEYVRRSYQAFEDCEPRARAVPLSARESRLLKRGLGRDDEPLDPVLTLSAARRMDDAAWVAAVLRDHLDEAAFDAVRERVVHP